MPFDHKKRLFSDAQDMDGGVRVRNLAGEEVLSSGCCAVSELKQLIWAQGGPLVAQQWLLKGDELLEEEAVASGELLLVVRAFEDGPNFIRSVLLIRSLSPLEEQRGDLRVLRVTEQQVEIDATVGLKRFTYHRVLDAWQPSQVFQQVGCELLQRFVDGYDSCVMAYGTSGSGKSESLWGSDGLMWRTLELFFACRRLPEWSLCCSIWAFATGGVYDLLSAPGHPEATHLELHSLGDLAKAFRFARGRPLRGPSADHLVTFTLRSGGVTRRMHLVECKGSEKRRPTGASGQRLTEGVSLSVHSVALSNVISALAAPRPRHIPYRDSKLTWCLRHVLGGSCLTYFLGHVSPSNMAEDETLSTLRYMQRAAQVENQPLRLHDIDFPPHPCQAVRIV